MASLSSFRHSESAKVLGCATGIFVLYSVYGVLQEKITRTKYGPDGEGFHFTFTLVLIQCIVNSLFAKLMMSLGEKRTDKTTNWFYFICSLSYVGAMLSSNYSLQFVSYPTQVLAKSCKPIPVMILGVLLAKKSYPALKYFFVLMITAGVALFMYNPIKASKGHAMEVGFGESLLALSLFLDGFTGSLQSNMKSRFNTNANNLMLGINFYSTISLSIIVLLSGEIVSFIPFIQKYPEVLLEMLAFAFTSACGQFFIFLGVTSFGPLTLSIITTTRKFFSVLVSVALFGNSLTSQQWFATIVVFTGLFLDSAYSSRTKSEPPKTKNEENGVSKKLSNGVAGKTA